MALLLPAFYQSQFVVYTITLQNMNIWTDF